MASIYKVTNMANGKVYIGQTRYTVEWRWHTHLYATFNEACCDHNSPLHCAIRKYGIDKFDVEVVETCKPGELNEKEEKWIKYYKSLVTENGYNISLAGGYKKYDDSEVIRLWNEGYSASEIARLIPSGMGRGTARHILTGAGITQEQIRKRGNEAIARSKEKVVYQYDKKTGELLGSFYSCSFAAKALHSTRGNIASAANGSIKSAAGFLWSYEKRDKIEPLHFEKGQRLIAKYDTSGELKALYISATAAAKCNPMTRKKITILCETERVYKGFFWKYLFIKDGVIFDESNI